MSKKFDVEHALNIYVEDFVYLPASAIYDDEILSNFADRIANCHVYLIGLVPDLEIIGSRVENRSIFTSHLVAGENKELSWKFPEGLEVKQFENGFAYPIGINGQILEPTQSEIIRRLREEQNVFFDVVYVGQAYGADGERHALIRLLKHETLQKIALTGVPKNYNLQILMLNVVRNNRVLTFFDPSATNKDDDASRIAAGLDKAFDENIPELVTLYEASLIRYFQPKYNKEFKNSFPSTNHKILKDCYDKDFSAIVAELINEEFPFDIGSKIIAPNWYHMIEHNLHSDEARRFFFFGSTEDESAQ